MSHFVGAVIVPTQIPTDVTVELVGDVFTHVDANSTLEAILAELLEPFSENIEVPRYLRETKAESIASFRAERQRVKETAYAEYLSDPASYRSKYVNNLRHVKWISEEFLGELDWTDEEVWAHQTEGYEEGPDYTDEGFFSTYNPQSKWDWYQVGGRWQKVFETRQGESVEALREALRQNLLAVEQDIPEERLTPMAKAFGDTKELVLPDGTHPPLVPRSLVIPQPTGTVSWFEKGSMGWFGMSHGDIEEHEWAANALKALEVITGDAKVIYVDFHI